MTLTNITKQNHLNVQETINHGSFYTCDSLIKKTYKLLEKYVNVSKYIVLDTSCGYGDFLKYKKGFKNIGVDIDKNCPFLHINASHSPNRKKYGIKENEPLLIIGNPPYNHKTSQISKKIKSNKYDFMIDSDLNCRDLGIGFLRSYVSLNPDFIAILHPLSYLIKEVNFKLLKDFKRYYKLIDSLIISSSYFTKSSNSFPTIIAIYKKGAMDYGYIKNFSFKVESYSIIKLNNFDYINNYIDKYPKKNINDDEIVGYFYTFKDLNTLKRSRTFLDKKITNAIAIKKEQLKCVDISKKECIDKLPFYFGNLDTPINNNEFLKHEKIFFVNSKIKEQYFQKLLKGHI